MASSRADGLAENNSFVALLPGYRCAVNSLDNCTGQPSGKCFWIFLTFSFISLSLISSPQSLLKRKWKGTGGGGEEEWASASGSLRVCYVHLSLFGPMLLRTWPHLAAPCCLSAVACVCRGCWSHSGLSPLVAPGLNVAQSRKP